jgi:heme-degrading monooxygenase HmoA
MITRIFRVQVPEALHQEFEAKFTSISMDVVKSQQGLIRASIGRPTQWSPNEYAMVTTWQDEQCLIAFAGESWNQAVIPKGMEKFVTMCWVHHYENFRDQQS